MKGIIWYKTKQKGIKCFDKIINNYNRQKIKIIKIFNSDSHDIVVFSNRDIWRMIKVSYKKGIGYNIPPSNLAYIEKGIKRKFIKEIIMPTVEKARPYNGYNFFD